jgi:hypothetical protein
LPAGGESDAPAAAVVPSKLKIAADPMVTMTCVIADDGKTTPTNDGCPTPPTGAYAVYTAVEPLKYSMLAVLAFQTFRNMIPNARVFANVAELVCGAGKTIWN